MNPAGSLDLSPGFCATSLRPAVDVLVDDGARPKREAPRKAVVEAIMMMFSADPKKPARTVTGPARRAAGRED